MSVASGGMLKEPTTKLLPSIRGRSSLAVPGSEAMVDAPAALAARAEGGERCTT